MNFFSDPDKVNMLHAQCGVWLGTPWFPNSNTPGRNGGVSCQKLVAELYRACGLANCEVPNVDMGHAQFSQQSLVDDYMDKRKDFEQVSHLRFWPELLAGDLLGFNIARIRHHLGIHLGENRFIHVTKGVGTRISSLDDATWSSRLTKVWRPIANDNISLSLKA